ncbi:hypothetical protein, partial [Nonomuraea sp. NPDC050786]|uniref:hypothetical protein n=1 Tax=Nonomuraea sp. NPDC050786 TaxID=3154840 RepID=UPI0033FCBBFF
MNAPLPVVVAGDKCLGPGAAKAAAADERDRLCDGASPGTPSNWGTAPFARAQAVYRHYGFEEIGTRRR